MQFPLDAQAEFWNRSCRIEPGAADAQSGPCPPCQSWHSA
jgi:hypothetical protein